MKRRPIKVQNMNDKYLLALFRSDNVIHYNIVVKEIKKRLSTKSVTLLLYKWEKEKNQTLKEFFEIAIANKFSQIFPVVEYEELPDIIKKYLDNISSIEAIVTLLNTNNKTLISKAHKKYCEFLENYLEKTEEADFDLYKTEGDDSFLFDKKETIIIPFPKELINFNNTNNIENTKVYKIKNYQRRNKK